MPIPAEAGEELEWELRFARSGAWIHVAEDEDGAIAGVVAFAAGQASREDRTLVPGLAHVNAVFVDPDHWRRGIARALLDAADGAMRAAGYRPRAAVDAGGLPRRAALHGAGLGPRRPPRRLPADGAANVAYVKAL